MYSFFPQWVLPEIVASAVIPILLLLTWHWFLFLLTCPLSAYLVHRWASQHLVCSLYVHVDPHVLRLLCRMALSCSFFMLTHCQYIASVIVSFRCYMHLQLVEYLWHICIYCCCQDAKFTICELYDFIVTEFACSRVYSQAHNLLHGNRHPYISKSVILHKLSVSILWLLYLFRYVTLPAGSIGVYDPTEIRNRGALGRFQKEAFIKIGVHLVGFFISLYG